MRDCTTATAVDNVVVVSQQLGQPKVRQLCCEAKWIAAVTLEQDVFWLDVTVQQLHVVKVLHACCNLKKHLQHSNTAYHMQLT